MSKKVIRISEENFKIIQNLSPGEFITIKSKKHRGKIVLKKLSDVNTEEVMIEK